MSFQTLRNVFASPIIHPQQSYLLGLRGFLVLQSFTFIFLQTFAPTTIQSSSSTDGPSSQILLRKTLSVLFWNESLIYSWFILLSARTICVPFINNPTSSQIASLAVRRGLRLWFPTAIALAIVNLTFSTMGVQYIATFISKTSNPLISIPYTIPNTLAYFNSVFNIFWISRDFSTQAASLAFPSQTLWIISVLYTQAYTIFLTMVIIPYTRDTWRFKGLIIFILTAWWVQSWAWFSVTGLLIADVVMNMDFKLHSKRGIPVFRAFKIPAWVVYGIVMAAGLTMQYLWTAWKPGMMNRELEYHTDIYSTGGLDTEYDVSQPQARADNYLVIVGALLLLESSDLLQWGFKNPVFLYLGRRSLSWFLVQSIIIYSAGIKLFLHLRITKNWPEQNAVVACLGLCFLLVVLLAELFYRVVDVPSQCTAKRIFGWLCK